MEFDFNANQTVESIDKVPEDFRGLYVEKDGKHVLNSEDSATKSAVSAITKLNTSLKASRAEAKANKSGRVDLSGLKDYGDAPDSILVGINAKIAEIKEAAKTTGSEAIERQVEKIKQDLAKAHSGDLEVRDKRIGALTGQLHNIMVQGEAVKALAEANAVDPDLILPFVIQQIKVEEKDGQFVPTVVDEAKDIRYSGVTGAPMSIKELVAEMKANSKFAVLFKSEAPSGGGKTPTNVNKSINKPGGELTSNQKIAAGLAKGQHSTGKK